MKVAVFSTVSPREIAQIASGFISVD